MFNNEHYYSPSRFLFAVCHFMQRNKQFVYGAKKLRGISVAYTLLEQGRFNIPYAVSASR